MIQTLANRMADYVVKHDKSASQEELAYGYSLILMGFVTYAAVIISSLLFGLFIEMLIAIGAFILMRSTIGGCHANHRVICFITYSGVLYTSILLSDIIVLSWQAMLALYFINIALLILYAPGDTVEQPMVRNRFLRKIFGLIFLSCLFAASFFLRDMRTETNILLFVSTSTCILLHPFIYRIYGCERSIN